MPRAVRVKLDPVPDAEPRAAGLIQAVRVGLLGLGKGASKAKQDTAAPAKITFRLALFETIRDGSEPEREVLGSLEGEVVLRGSELNAVFVVPPGAAESALTLEFEEALTAEVPPPPEAEPGSEGSARRPKPRMLPLEFDSTSFDGVQELEARLVVPATMLDGFRFLEVEAELEIDGSTEGSFEVNDLLDGRITANSLPPLPTYDVLLIDDIGKPLDGVALRFEEAGEETVLTTDATGFVRLVGKQAGTATVSVDDLAALRARLKPEWDKADRAKRGSSPPAGENTTVFALRGEESPSAILDTKEPRIIRVQPYVLLARLTGMFFDLNKTFLLRSALGGLKDVRALYDQHDPSKLLIVGHTDTSGAPSTNDPLSLERARSVAAYLSDDVPFWEKQYETSVAQSRRWGRPEDEQMIEALPDFQTDRQPGEGSIAFFQRTRGFPAEASLGKDERKQLITEYMDLDGANVKEQGLDIEIVNHGCGENFPLDVTGEELDEEPSDGQREQLDRRVELFFFDKELGVQPVVADGSNSKPKSPEYPEWRRRATELRQISAQGKPRDRHVSVVLLSNSGNVPLANRQLTLLVDGEAPFEGVTDADGVFEKSNLPAGDHLLTIEGTESFVSATPTSIVKRPHIVLGHVLIAENT